MSTDHVGDLDEAPVVLLVQRPHDAPLHRLQAVGEIWDGAVADDVARVFEKAFVHTRMQAHFELLRIKRLVDDGLDRLGDDVLLAITIRVGRFLRRRGFRAFDGQFRLVGFFFTLV